MQDSTNTAFEAHIKQFLLEGNMLQNDNFTISQCQCVFTLTAKILNKQEQKAYRETAHRFIELYTFVPVFPYRL